MCRRTGLEKKRRCGWLPPEPAAKNRPVWARGGIALETCPKSYVSAESLTLVEEFMVRKRVGTRGVEGLSAKQVEAFLILQEQLAAENKHGQQHTTDSI